MEGWLLLLLFRHIGCKDESSQGKASHQLSSPNSDKSFCWRQQTLFFKPTFCQISWRSTLFWINFCKEGKFSSHSSLCCRSLLYTGWIGINPTSEVFALRTLSNPLHNEWEIAIGFIKPSIYILSWGIVFLTWRFCLEPLLPNSGVFPNCGFNGRYKPFITQNFWFRAFGEKGI